MMSPASWRLREWVTVVSLLLLACAPAIFDAIDQPFYLDLLSRALIFGIAAISLNLVLGYGGMISFGHAAYLGLGAYCVGIPAYYDIYDASVHMPLAIGVGALFALITGAISLRTKGVYFIMITMAFSQMVYFALVSLDEYGGDDGLVINLRSKLPLDLGFWSFSMEDDVHLYYLILGSLVAAMFLVSRLVGSRFGMVIRGAKDNERRMQAIGFDTYRYRLFCYVISGAMCTYAGALLGNFTSFISPEMMDWARSGELIFMVVLGGSGSIFGPVLGAVGYLLAEETLSSMFENWHIVFGPILIIIVLFVRGGIDGLLGPKRPGGEG
ncbi:MAG: branched-chain amino acid ABC transporter permease [Rhodospirillales bacterium]